MYRHESTSAPYRVSRGDQLNVTTLFSAGELILTLHVYWKIIVSNWLFKVPPSRIIKPAIYLARENVSPKELASEISFRTCGTRFSSRRAARCQTEEKGRRNARREVTSREGHRRDTPRRLTFRRELNDARQVSLHFEPSINPHFRGVLWTPPPSSPIAPTPAIIYA